MVISSGFSIFPGSSPLRWPNGAADIVDVEEEDVEVVGVPDAEELLVKRDDTDEQEEECEVRASAQFADAEVVVPVITAAVFIFLVASLARHFSGVFRSGEVPKIMCDISIQQ